MASTKGSYLKRVLRGEAGIPSASASLLRWMPAICIAHTSQYKPMSLARVPWRKASRGRTTPAGHLSLSCHNPPAASHRGAYADNSQEPGRVFINPDGQSGMVIASLEVLTAT